MVDGLPAKPYGSRLPQQSGAKAGNAAQSNTGGSNNPLGNSIRQDVQKDRQQRSKELHRQYQAQTGAFQQDWDKIANMEKKMDLIKDKLRTMRDPTKRDNAQDRYNKLKWKVNELYQNSMFSADDAFSTALTPGF